MITYELAKKLKDAGYKQIWGAYTDVNDTSWDECWPEDIEDAEGELVYLPDLSELIEACGNKFGKLESPLIQGDIFDEGDKERWCVATVDGDDFEWGENPEHAVAKLWLLINKK